MAFKVTVPTAAAPTAILTALVPLADTPPEIAVIVAVPDPELATNLTVTRPAASVSAVDGSTRPRFVVKVSVVPECGGVPDASMTCAMMSVDPPIGRAVDVAVRVMVEPVGASSGTFWQATVKHAEMATKAASRAVERRRVTMKTLNILIPMNLRGQAIRKSGEGGYAMAALLVALSIMAVMLTVAMPVWKQASTREKEEELVFRGQQYAHAIGMFQRKFANAYPPNVDVLVQQRFLRKKFKDPITNEDFVPIPVGTSLPGSAPQGSGPRGVAAAPSGGRQSGGGFGGGSLQGGITPSSGSAPATGTAPSTAGFGSSPIGRSAGPGIGASGAGIAGVTSKSKDQSIRLYNGRGHYNEWAFVYTPQLQPGQGTPGAPGTGQRPGQPGLPGNNRGGFGTGPPGNRGPNPNPGPPGTSPFGGGRGGGPGGPGGFGTGQPPAQPIFGPQPTPRGRL